MGRKARARLRTWAEALVAEHGRDVAAILGMDPPLPDVTIDVVPAGGGAAWTSGLTVVLNERWFAEHPGDAGCVLHELSHAYLRAPEYSERTIWLIEGIADHTRDVLGFDAPWTFAHHEPGKATAGYQTTADFLAWLQERHPGAVASLSRELASGAYDEGAFMRCCGRPLGALVEAYEAARSR
ncbi:MAG: basic secretory protein-like protein [Planctomycetaceae bacterium]